MDFIEKSQNGSVIKTLTSVSDAEEVELMTRSQFIFYVSIRGVLLSTVMVLVSFLNINTIVVIYKYKVLQITSNALIVCFSIGNSLAAFNATLLLLSDYGFPSNTLKWKVNCVLFAFLTLYQHVNNLISITAISIERVYSIYFPLDSYRNNSFGRMLKIAVAVLTISCATIITEITIGFFTGNLKDTSKCTVYVVIGRYGWLVGFVTFSIGSVVCISSSLLIVGKLMHRKQNRNLWTSNRPTNTEYKITKMLIMGKVWIT